MSCHAFFENRRMKTRDQIRKKLYKPRFYRRKGVFLSFTAGLCSISKKRVFQESKENDNVIRGIARASIFRHSGKKERDDHPLCGGSQSHQR